MDQAWSLPPDVKDEDSSLEKFSEESEFYPVDEQDSGVEHCKGSGTDGRERREQLVRVHNIEPDTRGVYQGIHLLRVVEGTGPKE